MKTYFKWIHVQHYITLHVSAFNARMTSLTTPTFGQTVQFGTETLDIGDGYDATTSVYTTPIAGTYSFSWKIRITQLGFYITELVVNNSAKDYLITRSNDSGGDYAIETVTTANTVVSLDKGDQVYIRVQRRYQSPTMVSNTASYCTFSGWMIH